MGQPVTNVDPDFLAAIGETEATVTVADVVDLIFAYDPTLVTPDFTIFSSDGDRANDTLTTMTAGLAYILTIAEAGPLDPFIRNPDPDIDQLTHDGVPLDVPVPLKLTFTGLVDADPGTVSPSTDVVVGWNLVGPHSQADTDVATFLAAVTFPLRTWASLIAAKNILDLAYDDDGNAVLSADGTPVHDFTESLAFESLSGPPLLDNDPVPAGSGLWLFMGEDGELPPSEPTPTAAPTVAPVTVSLGTVDDNTLYEDTGGSLSNGAGSHLFVGKTDQSKTRRGLIKFDIAGNVPAGSTIVSVTLELNLSRTRSSTAQNVALHKLLADWGEGASVAGGQQGGGGSSSTGDATWVHTFFSGSTWASPGGDFSGTVSATKPVAGLTSYTWGSTAQMEEDVQAWLDSASSNFGWLLLGNEAANGTAKRFDTKENGTSDNRPTLTVTYLP